MSEKGNGKVTKVERMSDSEVITAARKMHTDDEWKILAKTCRCTVPEAIEREVKLLKLSENVRVQTYRRVLDQMRSSLVEVLTTDGMIEDITPSALDAEVRRKNPKLFV